MTRRVLRLSVVGVAALSWSLVALFLADAAGLIAGDDAVAVKARAELLADPCALRDPLPAGSDARCTFEIERRGTTPLVVDLDQRWQGNTLMQWLNVREPSVIDPVHFAYAQSAGAPQQLRILRLVPVVWGEGDEQLVYLVGRCGATACGSADLVVVGGRERPLPTLLRWRLGRLADVEVRDRALVVVEGSFPEGAQRPDALVARRFEWDGSSYALRSFALVPTPTPSPAPR